MGLKIDTLKELRELNLFDIVKDVFDKALKNGDLIYDENIEFERVTDPESEIENEIKIVSGLSKRPNNRASEPGNKDEEINEDKLNEVIEKNPFLKPEIELTVIDSLLGNYRLILNKFPNTKYHFLLVTKEFEKQDTLLKPIELQLMHTILDNLKKVSNKEYFSFFNSGSESGYSQFHKHIQFMMLPDGFRTYQSNVVRGVNYFIPKEIIENRRPIVYEKASYKHYILKLKEYDMYENEEQEEDERDSLAILYMYLIKRIMNIFKEFDMEDKKLSYNLLMMSNWMMIIPRRSAKFEDIWQNSLGFMGLFCVKNKELRDKVMNIGISKILQECGFPMEEGERDIVYNEYGY